jgi:hypothetical protein
MKSPATLSCPSSPAHPRVPLEHAGQGSYAPGGPHRFSVILDDAIDEMSRYVTCGAIETC